MHANYLQLLFLIDQWEEWSSLIYVVGIHSLLYNVYHSITLYVYSLYTTIKKNLIFKNENLLPNKNKLFSVTFYQIVLYSILNCE